MVFTDFKITKDGIYNYDTGVILSQDKFMTQKGEWSKRLLKSLSLMDNVDLNKFNNVFSKVYGGKTEFAKVLYEIIPNFKTQKTNILVNNKFYKSSYKKVLLENVQEDKNKFVSINKPVGEKLSQFKRDILLDIKKLDKIYDIPDCCVCLEGQSEMVMVPCGHLCLCSLCSDMYKDNKCPMCRSEITLRIHKSKLE